MSQAIERFRIAVDDSVLDDLRSRLVRARLPDQIADTGWEYGIPTDYLRTLVQYWRDEYDWRAQEARLNEFAHFRTRIDGQSIHFVHARSPHADAFPLLLVHGWPGSVVEFLEVIPRLTEPDAYGGDAGDAFHVVAPSLPGYGFSEPTHTRGWNVPRIARAFMELMTDLEYIRYGAQGGDWGAQVATRNWRARPGTLRGDPSQHADCQSSEGRRRTHRGGQGRPFGHAAVLAPGIRLRARAGHQAAVVGRRTRRLTGRAARVDRREVPRLERLRRRPGEHLHRGIR